MADPKLNPYAQPSEEFQEDSQGDAGRDYSPSAPDTTVVDLQDLDQDPRFRAWKSKMDKQVAEKEAELARFRASQVAAEDPNILGQQRNRLMAAWQQASSAAEQAEQEGDNATQIAAAAQAARLADKVFEVDVKVAAARRNVPLTPSLRQTLEEAYENGEITGPKDIDYILLTYQEQKVAGNGTATLKASDVDEMMNKLKKELELELRAKMGLSVPGVTPGASPGTRAKLLKDMEAAKQAKDMVTYLGLKRQLNNMEE